MQGASECFVVSNKQENVPAREKERDNQIIQLLQLLLGAEMVAVSALLLAAVVRTKGQTGVALAAHHLLAVVLLGQSSQGGLDHSSSHLEEHFDGGGLADSAGADDLRIVQLLSSEDKTLVVIVDVLLFLNHLLDVLHGLRGLNLKRDGVSLQDD